MKNHVSVHNLSTALSKPLPISLFVTGYATGYNSTMSSELALALVGLAGGYKEVFDYSEQVVNNLNSNDKGKVLTESETEVFYADNRELIIDFLTDVAKQDYKMGLLDYINQEYYNMNGDDNSISRVLFSDFDTAIQHGIERDSRKRLFIVQDCLTKMFDSIYLNLLQPNQL